MRKFYLDFETRSEVDLASCGGYAYAEHPSTRVLCAAYALDDGPLHLLDYHFAPFNESAPWLRAEALLNHGVGGVIVDPDVVIVARNAEFERLILWKVLGLELPPSKFRCTAAQCARAGLPRSLEVSGAVLGMAEQKDSNGKRLITKLCCPRRNGGFWSPEEQPEDFQQLYDYCVQDVRTDRGMHKALPEITDSEQKVWELTVRMNDRGVQVDTKSLPLAITAAENETERLNERFRELTGLLPTQVGAAAEALGVPDLTKATVAKALKTETDPKIVEALQIRQEVAKSSIAKLQAFLWRTSADGRVRGNLQYAGAERTARWSGSGVQPQNFPRGLDGAKMDEAFRKLHAREPLGLETISGMLRGFMVSEEVAA